MIYVLIVSGWINNHPSIATHDFESYSVCRSIAEAVERRFAEKHLKASCQPMGERT